MGVLLTIYTISFILCVIYTLFLIYTTSDSELIEFCESNGFSVDKLKKSINILSISSVIPIINTTFVIFAIYYFTKELFNE